MRRLNSITREELDAILKDRMEEIIALIEAITAQEENCDIKLAALLDGEPELVRIAIVEKLRELMEEREQEKVTALDRLLAQEKERIKAQQRGIFERWLVWVMSEETLRKIREAFMIRPPVEREVENQGEELSRKGVINMQQGLEVSRRDLGTLVANVSAALGRGKDQGKGKGGGI